MAENNKKANLADIARQARRQVAELTGRPPEAVLGVSREDGVWTVAVETVELERVPKASDLLASYVLKLDDDGELVEYRRGRRYLRGQPDEEGE